MENQQTFTFRVPLELDQDARNDIAIEVIDFIIDRTNRGLDKNNKPFAGYSDAYKNSLDFKIAGKSSNVNLQLSGDMLSEIRILNIAVTGFITIGYEAGTEENDRAAWNTNNTRPNFPKRDFLGIKDSDLNNIVRSYINSNPVQIQSRRATSSIANALIGNIIGNIFDNN